MEFRDARPVLEAFDRYLEAVNKDDAGLSDEERKKHFAFSDERQMVLIAAIAKHLRFDTISPERLKAIACVSRGYVDGLKAQADAMSSWPEIAVSIKRANAQSDFALAKQYPGEWPGQGH